MRTVYAIRDATGAAIAEHVRVDLPNGKRMFWQTPGGDPRDGLMGLSTPDLPLYGSEYLNEFPVGATVVVTEGERARDALWSLGIPSVATVTGASSTPGEDALSMLLPFDVVTWEDYDQAGHGHMARVAGGLIRLGGRARRLIWADARHKGDDAADFLERGGTRGAVEMLILAAEPWTVEAAAPPLRIVRPTYDRHDDSRVQTARSHLLQVVEQKLGAGKKSGQSIWWCCPFHSERTPSFKVDLREPYYRCHGCGARGDVFTFLREMEGVAFKDAIHELAPARLLGAAIPW